MLRIIQVGHNDASDRYVRNKMKAVNEAGMDTELISLSDDTTTEYIEHLLFETSLDQNISAVIVQLPLPKHIDKDRVFNAIAPSQDIDGLNPRSAYKPLTPSAIMRWLNDKGEQLEGRNVVILGRSELVGKPLATMLIEAGAMVTVCNSHSDRGMVERYCTLADIIVSAVGKVDVVNDGNISATHPQIIIDVGINRGENGKVRGDVSDLAKRCVHYNGGYVTPVPGGVGKWTVAELVIRLKEMESNG